jgi:hypothetical protein
MAEETAPEPREASRWPVRPLAVFAAFALLGLAVYAAALRGEFVSDDFGYIVSHPYTERLDASSIAAMFDPLGPAKLYAANYAPVHLLLTALERQIFADDPLGYHLVNVLLHALCATLLAALFLVSGIPGPAALLGGALFLLHPANVEAVAWASQLKTVAALAFSLGALLTLRRRPALATLLFALGLLTKASAAFALPTAAACVLALSAGAPAEARRLWPWLGAWAAVFALYAVPQSASFAHQGAVEVEAYRDPFVHLRSMAAVGARYLVMAATSYGVSAFQEPAPARSLLDPWWLAALPAGALLLWRTFATLRRRSVEAAFWVAAAASFAPVSQLFPFLIPLADRYLYFILPGLLGGALYLLTRRVPPLALPASRALAAAGLVLALCFGAHSAARAALWQSELRLLLDAARHYPEGATASLLRARRAAQDGEVELAIAELRRAAALGIDDFQAVASDPGLAPLRTQPAFRELLAELAGLWIERTTRRGVETQSELRMRARAHLHRGELELAIESFERALALGGPRSAEIRAELDTVRAEQLRRAGAAREEERHLAPGS